jgi:hypothetical protein
MRVAVAIRWWRGSLWFSGDCFRLFRIQRSAASPAKMVGRQELDKMTMIAPYNFP